MDGTHRSRFYAAPFEAGPLRIGYLVVESDVGSLRRVDVVSDWLLASAVSTTSTNTLKSMAQSLAPYWEWCSESGVDPLRTDAVTFAKFITALQQTPKGYRVTSPVRALPGDPRLRSDATVRLRVIHIKSFYAWALANGRIQLGVARAIAATKTPRAMQKRSAPRMTPAQARIMTAANLHPRNRLAVELLYAAGLRDGEATGLRHEDMCVNRDVADVLGCDFSRGPHLHVRRRLNPNGALAKSPFERPVPISARLMNAYREWQAWTFEYLPESLDTPFLLLSLSGRSRGAPLTLSGFYSMWSAKVTSTPGLEGVNPHLLRHTFASELADAGVESFTIQTLLGHRSPTSTQVYTHPLASTLHSAVDRLGDWRQQFMVDAK